MHFRIQTVKCNFGLTLKPETIIRIKATLSLFAHAAVVVVVVIGSGVVVNKKMVSCV
jgi:hypothetical protein